MLHQSTRLHDLHSHLHIIYTLQNVVSFLSAYVHGSFYFKFAYIMSKTGHAVIFNIGFIVLMNQW